MENMILKSMPLVHKTYQSNSYLTFPPPPIYVEFFQDVRKTKFCSRIFFLSSHEIVGPLHKRRLVTCVKLLSMAFCNIQLLIYFLFIKSIYEGWNFNFGNTPPDWIQKLLE